jgi:hypothetical protein
MMMGQMPMQNPFGMYMPMMDQMTQPMTMQDMPYDEDERDEEYFAGMHSDVSREMMPYVLGTVDRMEQKGDMIYVARPRREMVDRMTDEAYNDLVTDMPDMSEEMDEERQFGGRRRFSRDLLRVLLLNELLRRRRRRRRFHHSDEFGFDSDFGNFY